ncbi:MAG: hypothetical protein AB3N21_12540 [Ruegeria sp.]|uniref:hypothetical protein n=1 Tax=Ruegeria sp. TaxID=1879320 RepID=UPI00349EE2B2
MGDLFVGGIVKSREVENFIASLLDALAQKSPAVERETVVLFAIGEDVFDRHVNPDYLPGLHNGLDDLIASREISPIDCYIDRIEMTSGQVVFWTAANISEDAPERGKKCAATAIAMALSIDVVAMNKLSPSEMRRYLLERVSR